MNRITTPGRIALVGTLVAVLFGFAPDLARAAYTAQVEGATLKISGDGASDKLAFRLAPGAPGTLEVDVGADGTADFSFDRSTFTAIDVDAGAGDDEVRRDSSFGAFSDELVTMDGGSGDDTLLGSIGNDTIRGGTGDDTATGGDGDDTALLGGGDDTFTWNPGDDNDTVEGEGGKDVLVFNGSNIAELMEATANGPRVRFTRNIASIVMDLAGVERLTAHTLGGADSIVVGDLSGTDLRVAEIHPNLLVGDDGQADSVTARGTDGPDSVEIANAEGHTVVDGLAAETRVVGSESALDEVSVATLAGEDTISIAVGVFGPAAVNVDGGEDPDTARYEGSTAADLIELVANGTEVSTLAAGTTRFDTITESLVVRGLAEADTITAVGNLAPLTAITFDGGDGNDILRGGNGADLLLGGAGADQIDGNQGSDRALMGGGDDRFQWDPGDGNDTVEGQGGNDLLDFFGSNIGELIEVTANGPRVRFTRNIANIAMDLDGVEQLTTHTLGGADTITIGDLSDTDLDDVEINLTTIAGTGDDQPDVVVVQGKDGRDVVSVTKAGEQVLVSGLPARTRIVGGEPANDTLRVETLGGNDSVTVAPDVSDVITTVVDLGADE